MAQEAAPTFHAYAKSGTVAAPVCYVNYGRVEDYLTLKEKNGVNVSGTIVLARYGKIYRGDIVKNAYEEGAVGVVIYSDRKDYGGGGGEAKWFPDERWLPPSGVQVGTVYGGLGDPTTPGWASSGGDCERLSKEEVEKRGEVPLIPSLPVSAADGEKIVLSLGGPVAEDEWQGSKDAPHYRLGPGPGILNLSYMVFLCYLFLSDSLNFLFGLKHHAGIKLLIFTINWIAVNCKQIHSFFFSFELLFYQSWGCENVICRRP